MPVTNKAKYITIFGLVIMLFTACHQRTSKIPETILSGKVTIAADESLQPMMNAELHVFQSMYSYAKVDCGFSPENEVLTDLIQEKIRLAIVARPLKQQEIDFFKSKNIPAESIPLSYDAIAVFVNPGNNTAWLSLNQLKQILSGTINDWAQVYGSGKKGAIRLIFDSKSSGILRSLNDSLHLDDKIAGMVSFSGASSSVISAVASNPDAIGFVGYNWLSENENPDVRRSLEKIKLLAVSKNPNADAHNSCKPSIATIYNRKYPLIREIYAIYTDPAAGLSKGFLAQLTSERGQRIIYRIGLLPADDLQRQILIKSDY